MVLYGGDAQQGKSRITAAVAAMIAAADDAIASAVQERLDSAEPPAGVDAQVWESQKPRQVTVKTIGMQDFTPTELFARCSGDWDQIEDRSGRNVGRAKGRGAPERPPIRSSAPPRAREKIVSYLVFRHGYLGRAPDAGI